MVEGFENPDVRPIREDRFVDLWLRGCGSAEIAAACHVSRRRVIRFLEALLEILELRTTSAEGTRLFAELVRLYKARYPRGSYAAFVIWAHRTRGRVQ